MSTSEISTGENKSRPVALGGQGVKPKFYSDAPAAPRRGFSLTGGLAAMPAAPEQTEPGVEPEFLPAPAREPEPVTAEAPVKAAKPTTTRAAKPAKATAREPIESGTKILYTSFDFLGYTFRGRLARGRRGYFVSFSPAISTNARKAVGQKVRPWHLNRRSGSDLSGLAQQINPVVRGWIGYYGVFYRSELHSLARHIDQHLLRWSCRSSNACAANAPRPKRGWTLFDSTSRVFSPTGTSSHPPQPDLWEPYDGRLSRTVLRAPEGATPSGDSPNTPTSKPGWPETRWSPCTSRPPPGPG